MLFRSDGRQLHRARETFTVRRHLKLTLTPPAETVEPGAETEIKLTATDQQGRPVQAELSLALASQSLFAEYSDHVSDIGEFFSEGARSGSSYRFQSTAGFEVRAQSHQLHAAKDGGAAKSVVAVNHVERIRQLERQESEVYQSGGQQTLTLNGGNTFTGNADIPCWSKVCGICGGLKVRATKAPCNSAFEALMSEAFGLNRSPNGFAFLRSVSNASMAFAEIAVEPLRLPVVTVP